MQSRRQLLRHLAAVLGGGALVVLGTPAGRSFAASSQVVDQPPAPLTYVAIGASDGVGTGADDPSSQGWVPLFAGALGADTQLVNLSSYGALVDDAQLNQLPQAVDAQPDVVTVWLGVNDFNRLTPLLTYQQSLRAILGTLRDQTLAQVLVGNLPDLSHVKNYSSVDPVLLGAEVRRWNRAIAAEAADSGSTLVDLYSYGAELAAHPEYVSADGLHPSAAGYRRVADLFIEAFGAPVSQG